MILLNFYFLSISREFPHSSGINTIFIEKAMPTAGYAYAIAIAG
ncbi:hypothetical protein [Nostoc sp.]